MSSAGEDLDWPSPGHMAASRGGGLSHGRGPRWIVSLRALVVVLAMMAAALGMLWLESAGVQGASAQLATESAGKVVVPPLAGSPSLKGTLPKESTPSPVKVPPAVPPADGEAVTAAGSGGAGSSPPANSGAQPGAGNPEGKLVVHVAGAVKSPGVFMLDPGSRVFQAVDAAGGALPAAELAALNLAAPLTDGLQILVPTKEQAATMAANPGAGQIPGQETVTPNGAGTAQQGLINVNTATAAELDALPGIGPVLAERIVDWRTEHGPYASVDALDGVSGIGAKLLAGIRDLVTVS
ncbi:helix-hairpin-helix domain-containing protein [Specibacter sp. AOP5-B1-6]|uniref:helix-hairpin-helix domain-containing protein n=1 Tax=Specibacter sp. AOP5-B1-6 TaxID=3457653 RepID=UPI00402BDEB3